MKYILVLFSESQNYMEEPWFQTETFLANSVEANTDQEWVGNAAYFIPEKYYKPIKD